MARSVLLEELCRIYCRAHSVLIVRIPSSTGEILDSRDGPVFQSHSPKLEAGICGNAKRRKANSELL
jgi:hypothetical protein